MGEGSRTPVASESVSLDDRIASAQQQTVAAASALVTDGGFQAQDARVDTQWGVNVAGNHSYDSDTEPFFERFEDATGKDYFSQHYIENDIGADQRYGPRGDDVDSDWGKLETDADAGTLSSTDTSGNEGNPASSVGFDPSSSGIFDSSEGSGVTDGATSAESAGASWETITERNEQVVSGDEGASSLPSDVMDNVEIIDSEGNIHEEGAVALQSDAVAEAITRTGAHYDSDYIVSIGNKINDLRQQTDGQVNIHDATVASEFTTREKEIIANWQLTGNRVDEFTDSNGEFMQATVLREGTHSASDVEESFNETGELLFATHSNTQASDCINSLREQNPSTVSVDELAGKIHQQQSVSQVASIKRETDVTVQSQIETVQNNMAYNTPGGDTKCDISDVDRDVEFSDAEIEAIANGVIDTMNTDRVNEFTGRISEVLGYERTHGFDFGKQNPRPGDATSTGDLRSVIPSEGVIIAGQHSSQSGSSKLSVGLDESGNIMNKQKNQSSVDVSPDELTRVLTFQTRQDADGVTQIDNVSMNDLDDVTNGNPTRKSTADVSTHVSTSGDGIPDQVNVTVVGDEQFSEEEVTSTSGTDVGSLTETNDPPSKDSTVTTGVLADRIDTAFNDQGDASKLFLVNTGDASGNKAMGDDGEIVVLDAISDEFDVSDVDQSQLGAGEENQFPDIARAQVEVKLYSVGNSGSVSLGQSRDPASTDPLTEQDSLSQPLQESEDPSWAADNATPANTRYVKLFYDGDVQSNITDVDGETAANAAKQLSDRQPNKRGELFENGEEGYKEWREKYESSSGDGDIHQYLANDADEAIATVEDVVISSGEDLTNGADRTSVDRKYEIEFRSDVADSMNADVTDY